jgi:hypothetical protein
VHQLVSQINGFWVSPLRKALLFLIALASMAFGVCSPAAAQISLVSGQVASAFTFSSVTSLSAALPNNPGTNHLVPVCAAIRSVSSQSPITAQDGDGNNLTASSPLLVNQTGQQFNLAAAYLVAPAPVSNSKTITVSWANAVAGSAVWAAEFQGNATSSVFEADAPATNQGPRTTINTDRNVRIRRAPSCLTRGISRSV